MSCKPNYQGGKDFGARKAQQEAQLDSINQEFLDHPKYGQDEGLPSQLETFKKKYMEFDLNSDGEIDLMSLKQMLEKLGVAKTHLELKRLLHKATGGTSDTISYRSFVRLLLGPQSDIRDLILLFESKAKEQEPSAPGPPRKRDITELP
ncbi:allograft inflammatory factor 1 [Alligator mississippiensis]|uniref:allograft inflammatory factor 1 n=1 Tax=Alligator mississippiensis TaxID=8496 RepID=UPI002877A805|nr:allograft inflammatory factor 1 [Alligator mississippiensis]